MRFPIALLLLLTACTASQPKDDPGKPDSLGKEIETEDYIAMGPGIQRAHELPIGAFLGEVGKRIQAWSRARLDGDDDQLRLLSEVLEFECAKRQGELIEQLESGPPRNRALAAVALGYAKRQNQLQNDLSTIQIDKGSTSLGPLLAAIDDPDPKVAANALMGIGILERPETPLEPITRALSEGTTASVRSNAAFAITAIAKAARGVHRGGGQDLDEDQRTLGRSACVHGLGDADLGVRVQCAAALGLLGNESTIAFLGDRLDDEVALVSQAASVALVRLARDDTKLKGKVARLLANRLDNVRPTRRDTVLYGLVLLAGRQMGDSTEVWQDWARRLPSS